MESLKCQMYNLGGTKSGREGKKAKINPFKAQYGEFLPKNVERNFSEFLVRTYALTFEVDGKKLKACIVILRDQVAIAKFIGPEAAPQAMG